MPFIDVKMFPGRDEEVKKAFAEKVVDLAIQELGCPREALSVGITEVAAEDWNAEVADKFDEEKIVVGEMYRSK